MNLLKKGDSFVRLTSWRLLPSSADCFCSLCLLPEAGKAARSSHACGEVMSPATVIVPWMASSSYACLCSFIFFGLFFNLSIVPYNIVLVLDVQQSDLVICFFFFFSYMFYIYIYIYIYILFQILFPYRLFKNVEYSSLYYTVGPC